MNDIVERLTEAAAMRDELKERYWHRASSLKREAADEITRLRQLLSEAEKREKELVAMLNSADESRLVQIRRAEASEGREKEARNVALEEAAAIVDAVSHEGLHNSMWRCRFERVAADIRALQSEGR